MLNPFSITQMEPVPQDWQVRPPDFVGVGTQKAGTTWWYSLLLKHPQIVENRLLAKELHYFPHFTFNGIEEHQVETYRQAFATPEGSISGEWTPGYFFYPLCLDYLARSAPEAKILIILRDPIQRFLSGLDQLYRGKQKSFNLEAKGRYILETFSLFPEAVFRSLYANGLRHLLHLFPRDRILVLQYESCKRDPLKEISRTYRFLAVDDQFQPSNVFDPVNKKERSFTSLNPEQLRWMASYFADDVQSTHEIFPEIDLRLWPDFL